MFVAAAFCPQPPLLHPEVLGAAGRDLTATLRSACSEALDRVLAADPEAIVVLGGVDAPARTTSARMAAPADGRSEAREYGPGDAGDLVGYGVPVRLGFDGPPSSGAARLPLAHTLGAWLLDQAGFTGQRLGLSAGAVPTWLQGASADERRWAILVMGDGSARRTEKSPGWYDPDAVAFDDAVIAALASGDGKALLDLDVTEGERVLAAGHTAWNNAGQILAGVPMVGRLHYAQAPFGVFYAVASWGGRP